MPGEGGTPRRRRSNRPGISQAKGPLDRGHSGKRSNWLRLPPPKGEAPGFEYLSVEYLRREALRFPDRGGGNGASPVSFRSGVS